MPTNVRQARTPDRGAGARPDPVRGHPADADGAKPLAYRPRWAKAAAVLLPRSGPFLACATHSGC
ncbi:hypothetical protein SPHINGOT1_70246 [Sphingomonas sp. T1]|nr:hypothetical protein SPHINGOT1_70246 [Sphingomonas sp. T1]